MPTELLHKIIPELKELGYTDEIFRHLFNEPRLDKRLVFDVDPLWDLSKYVYTSRAGTVDSKGYRGYRERRRHG